MNIEISVVQWLAIYSTIALLISCWLLYYANQKYDWFDWQLNRTRMLNKVMLRALLWPFFLVAPKQLIKPVFDFKPDKFEGRDEAELARKRAAFMDNPPPCGNTISFSGECGWSKDKGEFLFPADVAHEFAVKKWRKDRTLSGIRGAIWWLGLRDEALAETTPVPEMLENFDQIARDLIDAGVGQVRCPECNKIYAMTDIISETPSFDLRPCSSVWKFINCPEGHGLMNYEYMRIYIGQPADDSAHESKDKKDLEVPKFTKGLD